MSESSSTIMPKVTLTTLEKMRASGEKIAMLTCYDASFATLMDQGGVDTLLIGDKDHMQRVKDVVEQLRRQGRTELL